MPGLLETSSFPLNKLFECPFTWSNRIARPVVALLTEEFAVGTRKFTDLILGKMAEVAEKKTLVFLATAVNLNAILFFHIL